MPEQEQQPETELDAPEAAEPEEADDRLSPLVDDETVIEATLAGTDTVRPVKFRYRPMDAIEAGKYQAALLRCKADIAKLKIVVARMLAARIIEWDVTDRARQPVPHNNHVVILRLHEAVLYGLQKIIESSAQSLEEAEKNS